VLRVAQDLVGIHNFGGEALARSYLDLSRRGHLTGSAIPELIETYNRLMSTGEAGALGAAGAMTHELERLQRQLVPPPDRAAPTIDYARLVLGHNHRRRS
jgi:hypothetical protein